MATPQPAQSESDRTVGIGDKFYHKARVGGGTVKVLKPGVAWNDATRADLVPAEVDPADAEEASRWCVFFEDIFECDHETAVILFLDPDSGDPMMQAIDGPEHDHAVAIRIVARDLAAKPREPDARAVRLKDVSPRQPRTPANDNKPAQPQTFELVNPADWDGKKVPPREWYLAGLIPGRQVTIMSGDGGTGKTLLKLQIAAAGAMGIETLGLTPEPGRVLFFGAEDEAEEFHRRLADIVVAHDKTLADLSDFRLMPMAGQDALLAIPDRAGVMRGTPLWEKFVEAAVEFEPKLIVLDTIADIFGGDEIKRGQARQFITMLRTLAIALDCAVVVLAHPSQQGMASGSGRSGSTGWSNSSRGMLYLTRPEGADADPDVRILSTKKVNYGRIGGELRIRWQDGCFALDNGKPGIGSALVAVKHERAYLDLLSKLNRQGHRLSPSNSPTFGPKVMAKHADAGGITKKQFEAAQQRLLDSDRVRIVEEGPPSRRYRRLMPAEECFGAELRAPSHE